MDSEIVKQLWMNYWEQCAYLQNKYGLPSRDYFCNESCKSKTNSISRTSEGLVIHHNAEGYNSGGNLGNPNLAKHYPFEYQKRENLSYCNLIEHLLLHLKINARCCSEFEYPFEFQYFFNSLGFFWIATLINTLFKEHGSKTKWLGDCFLAIESFFDDYISILKGVLCFLDDNYVGDRNIQFIKGKKLCYDIIDTSNINNLLSSQKDYYVDNKNIKNRQKRIYFTINNVLPDKDIVEIRYDGELVERSLSKYQSYYDLSAQKRKYLTVMCSLEDGTVWTEMMDKLSKPYTSQEKTIACWIKEKND